ncbi:MAG: oligosaccharide flippase family protein [Syntrophaceae bacterium]|nr:oligosaccharide flippase family protein [Syntrophaceae bacterium]
MTKRLLLNSGSAWILYAVNIVVAFIMSPVVVRELGNRDYGIWEMLLSFCGYFGILELGLGPAIIRYVAREIALENPSGLNRIFNSGFWGLLLVGLISLGGMALASLWPEKLLNLQPGEVSSLPALCVIAGLNLLVQFVGILFVALLMGRQEHFKINLFRSCLYVLQAFFIYLALTRWGEPKLVWIASVTLVGNLFQYVVLAGMSFSGSSPIRLRKDGFSVDTAKELYRFGFNSAITMVSDRILRQSLPLVIGHLSGAAIVVFFALPKRLVDYASDFMSSINMPLMPYFSSIDALREKDTPMKEWFPISRAVSFLTGPAACVLMVLGEPFLNLWIGPEYGTGGRWVVLFLSVSFWVTGAFSNSSRVLIAGGQHGPPARKVLLISILAILLSLPATRFWGVSGAALVLFLADSTSSWVFWRAASTYAGIRLSEHLDITLKPLVLPLSFLLTMLLAARIWILFTGYFELMATASLSMGLYLVAAWRFALHPQEREKVRLELRRFSVNTWIGFRKAVRRGI